MFNLSALLIVYLGANGLVMLIWPEFWYETIPGADVAGPLNVYFLSHLGVVFLLAGAAFVWRLVDPIRGSSAGWIASAFLVGHAANHLFEMLSSAHYATLFGPIFITELLTIYLPPMAAIYISLKGFIPLPVRMNHAVRFMAQKQIGRFEKQFNYDGTYMHEIAEASPEALIRFSLLEELGNYSQPLPTSAWYASKLAGSIFEDCGPCTQLVTQMAEIDGVDRATLKHILRGESSDLDLETRLFFDHANAVLNHDIRMDELRQEIIEKYGKPALIASALAILTGRAYPLLKYALGHGHVCARVSIEGQQTMVKRNAQFIEA